MLDDVRAGGAAGPVAEPLARLHAFNDALGVAHAAVAARPRRRGLALDVQVREAALDVVDGQRVARGGDLFEREGIHASAPLLAALASWWASGQLGCRPARQARGSSRRRGGRRDANCRRDTLTRRGAARRVALPRARARWFAGEQRCSKQASPCRRGFVLTAAPRALSVSRPGRYPAGRLLAPGVRLVPRDLFAASRYVRADVGSTYEQG